MSSSRKREIEPEPSSRRVSTRTQPNGAEITREIAPQPTSSSNRNENEQARATDTNEERTKNYNPHKYKLPLKPRELDNFERIPVEAQAQCIKAIARLLIIKGGKKEPVKKDLVIDVLGKIDSDYKKHANCVLRKVQGNLYKHFGYVTLPGDAILGMRGNGKKEEFYVTSDLGSERLGRLLRKKDENNAFFGFMNVIFCTIYTSSGKKAAVEDLLLAVRKVDPRFPGRLPSKNDKLLSVPVEELGDDFLGLLGRMKKESYIVQVKDDDSTSNDPAKVLYTFGPRYFLDIGHKQLMMNYYGAMGQPADKAILKEIEEELRKEIELPVAAEEGNNPATAPAAASTSAVPAASSSSSGGKSRK